MFSKGPGSVAAYLSAVNRRVCPLGSSVPDGWVGQWDVLEILCSVPFRVDKCWRCFYARPTRNWDFGGHAELINWLENFRCGWGTVEAKTMW